MSAAGTQPRTVIEIDLPYCALSYGTAPCTAAVGTTGTDKCYNSIRTCQDRANFEASTRVLRLCDKASDNYFELDGVPVTCIPSVQGVNITPAVVRPGQDAGERETVSITCEEHPDSDTLLDKYVGDRAYVPREQGTFWSKLRARWVSLEGVPIRVLMGDAGQDLNTYRVRHYVLSGISGGGFRSVTLAARDPFALTDAKKSQAPRPSNGRLLSSLASGGGSCTLTPSGIGAEEYPASGEVCLGGKEVAGFTRSGDVLTLTRGIANTVAQDHDADTVAQLVLKYESTNGGAIAADLLTNYTDGIESGWVDGAAWEAEIDEYYGTLFTARITAPTPVNTLLNELIAQLPAVFFWDSTAQMFKLYALRPATPDTNTIVHLMEGSVSVTEQPGLRAGQLLTYYGQRDPTEKVDEIRNYACALLTADEETSFDYVTQAQKQITSRWIPAAARSAVQLLNATYLERYRDAPRGVKFSVWHNHVPVPELGQIVRLTHSALQDASGAQVIIPVQITSLEPHSSHFEINSQEVTFRAQDGSGSGGVRYIYIDTDTLDINLRTLYDTLYTTLDGIDTVRLVISPSVFVGGTDRTAGALRILAEDWPVDVDIELHLSGSIYGRGGDTNTQPPYAVLTAVPGGSGGLAFKVSRPVTVFGDGVIAGGGGGSAPTRVRHYFSNASITAYATYTIGCGGQGYPAGQGIYYSARFGYDPGQNHGTLLGPGARSEVFRFVDVVASSPIPDAEDEDASLYSISGGALGASGTSFDYVSDADAVAHGVPANHFKTVQKGIPGTPGAAIEGVSFLTFDPSSDITIIGATS